MKTVTIEIPELDDTYYTVVVCERSLSDDVDAITDKFPDGVSVGIALEEQFQEEMTEAYEDGPAGGFAVAQTIYPPGFNPNGVAPMTNHQWYCLEGCHMEGGWHPQVEEEERRTRGITFDASNRNHRDVKGGEWSATPAIKRTNPVCSNCGCEVVWGDPDDFIEEDE